MPARLWMLPIQMRLSLERFIATASVMVWLLPSSSPMERSSPARIWWPAPGRIVTIAVIEPDALMCAAVASNVTNPPLWA